MLHESTDLCMSIGTLQCLHHRPQLALRVLEQQPPADAIKNTDAQSKADISIACCFRDTHDNRTTLLHVPTILCICLCTKGQSRNKASAEAQEACSRHQGCRDACAIRQVRLPAARKPSNSMASSVLFMPMDTLLIFSVMCWQLWWQEP